ncbi:MAG TPA: RNA polymerase subunit sigma-70 [Solirubrobacteraceae bacterium]|nr:RNA polymerase subunit sigma-70 [Solirubrobacteraceae bacterium]
MTARAAETGAVLAAARAGDESAFARLVEPHRRELHVHCYRMVASFEDAEDLVQETFLRAWRSRHTFDRGDWFRAWLYRIATNVCLDSLRRNARRAQSSQSIAEVPWLQPYPDRLLDEAEVAPSEEQPDAVVVARETIELAYLAVIQLLPPRQRAVLVLRDVLEWSASETASALEMSVAAANSALQRARATLAEQPAQRRLESTPAATSAAEEALLRGFIETHERGDSAAALALVREDIRVTMPPNPGCHEGIAAIASLMARAFHDGGGMGEWRLVPTRANRQPAAASYLRAPGDTQFRAFKLDVLRVEGDRIAEITTFGSGLFGAFGLAPTLQALTNAGAPAL